jgi:hypothetical protein
MTAEAIAKILGGWEVGCGLTACSPAHDDRDPSLFCAPRRILPRVGLVGSRSGEQRQPRPTSTALIEFALVVTAAGGRVIYIGRQYTVAASG